MLESKKNITNSEIILKIIKGDYIFENLIFDENSVPYGNLDFNIIISQARFSTTSLEYELVSKEKVSLSLPIELVFINCEFNIKAYFNDNECIVYRCFQNVQFNAETFFWSTKFYSTTPSITEYIVGTIYLFDNVRFAEVQFLNIIFNSNDARFIFNEISFNKNAYFIGCRFELPFKLDKLEINGDLKILSSHFNNTFILQDITLNGNFTIGSVKNGSNSIFNKKVIIQCSLLGSFFVDDVEFNAAFVFMPTVICDKNIEFNRVKFNQISSFRSLRLKENVMFIQCNLENCSFLYSQFENTLFSNCTFPFYKAFIDEKILLDENFQNYSSSIINNMFANIQINDVLNQLRMFERNFDKAKDFDTAGEFHIKRYELDRCNQKLLSIKWLLLIFYKLSSNYGENYIRCLILIFTICFIFSLIYPVTGITYANEHIWWWDYSKPILFTDWGSSLLYSLISSSPIKRDSEIVKSLGGWTTALSIIQTIIQTILGTLFIIGIRRKFKR